MVMVGDGASPENENNINEMLNYAKDTKHEKIIRGG